MITINGLVIDSDPYLIEEINYKNVPTRDQQTAIVTRKPRIKLLSNEWQQKEIEIKGRVFGSTPTDLLTKLDTLQQNMAVQSAALSIDSGRTYTVDLKAMDIPTQFYNVTMVSYTAKLLATDPFAYGTLLTASGTVASGIGNVTGTLTISGSVFAEPLLTINPKGANIGDSGIKAMKFTYTPTAEALTISGMFNYAAPVIVDFRNFLVTNSGVSSDYLGSFSRFTPGSNSFTITVTSGVNNGFNYGFSYQPRYYQ
jgi:hypothetical protein